MKIYNFPCFKIPWEFTIPCFKIPWTCLKTMKHLPCSIIKITILFFHENLKNHHMFHENPIKLPWKSYDITPYGAFPSPRRPRRPRRCVHRKLQPIAARFTPEELLALGHRTGRKPGDLWHVKQEIGDLTGAEPRRWRSCLFFVEKRW